jgi:hypothetical protein
MGSDDFHLFLRPENAESEQRITTDERLAVFCQSNDVFGVFLCSE